MESNSPKGTDELLTQHETSCEEVIGIVTGGAVCSASSPSRISPKLKASKDKLPTDPISKRHAERLEDKRSKHHNRLGEKASRRNEEEKEVVAIEKEAKEKREGMRTAGDVVNRILWDDWGKQVTPEDFIVGYLDRFEGLLEESFVSFNWEDDLSTLSQMDKAIPQHRIQYFKFKGVIVWDKRHRMDNIFGSCGGMRFEDFLTMDQSNPKKHESPLAPTNPDSFSPYSFLKQYYQTSEDCNL